jgi:hypothetical protein
MCRSPIPSFQKLFPLFLEVRSKSPSKVVESFEMTCVHSTIYFSILVTVLKISELFRDLLSDELWGREAGEKKLRTFPRGFPSLKRSNPVAASLAVIVMSMHVCEH